ncbi:MAG: hypothetical protein IPO10_13855 [Flavobacteriales bacterium]|nr:hypothetical protein [Flavobacteriales bacterium]
MIHLEQGRIATQNEHGISNTRYALIVAINVELELLFYGVGQQIVEEQYTVLVLDAGYGMIIDIGKAGNLVEGIGQYGDRSRLVQIISRSSVMRGEFRGTARSNADGHNNGDEKVVHTGGIQYATIRTLWNVRIAG